MIAVFMEDFHVLFHEIFHQRFDSSLHEAFHRRCSQGGLDGSSWKLSFTEATSMETTFMSVWMGGSMKACMNFTRKQHPGFGCFRRICRSNFCTFGGNGSQSSLHGSFHGSSSHGCYRGSRGYRTTSPSPSSREEGPSREASAVHHPWPTPMEEVREIPERTPVVASTKHAPTARRLRSSTITNMNVVLHVLQPKPTKRSRATPRL